MFNPELRPSIESEARSELIESVTSYWLEAYSSGKFDIVSDRLSDTMRYQFSRGDEEALTRYTFDLYYQSDNESVTPNVFTLRKKQFVDHMCLVEEAHIETACTVFLYRSGVVTYDELNETGLPIDTIINDKLAWDKRVLNPIERLTEELKETLIIQS